MSFEGRIRHEHGAVLVHVVGVMFALIVITALVFDYGVQLLGRRQIQNAADAAALAAASSLAFVDAGNVPLAQNAGVAAATQNLVWGQPSTITTGDITVVGCPPPNTTGTCVRANAFRNSATGSPLPTYFAGLIGVADQDVRATATARILAGMSATCVKPWAIPDKWLEVQTPAWDPTDTFEAYIQNGRGRGNPLPNPDVYTAPSGSSPGTGFRLPADYGWEMTLKDGNPAQAIAPGWFFPVVIDPNQPPGGARYRAAIEGCASPTIGPGTILQTEPGNMIGPTRQGVEALIAQDPGADWTGSGLSGHIVGGCMQAGTCTLSPRVVAIPVFNVDLYDQGRASGRIDITVTNILGFDRMQGNDVIGYLVPLPALAPGGPTGPGAFVFTVVLVR